ncbi:hypothetical protein [Streptomyces sp. NRRL WC-3723]|uniref:hypothetical protein n=2 Tax=unclassified Streptomyces TaxID=2593676 RepID=UPI00131D4321|nr:hypothetical protein [Streptomyces sp. NRRL WC-3723]
MGIRYYSRGFPKKQPQKHEQEQEQEAKVPATNSNCTPVVADIACVEDMGNPFSLPGFNGLRMPSLGGIRGFIPLPGFAY